jgi:hypothetical protein
MRRFLIIVLFIVGSAKADILFRDEHRGYVYRFETNTREVRATVRQKAVIERANAWAEDFYADELLQATDIHFKRSPLRFWLVTFKEPMMGETFYSVILPDGTIVEPVRQEQI